MPRVYKRKTNRQNWSKDAMTKALDAVRNGMQYKTASKQFSVPVMALKRRAKGQKKNAVGAVKTLGSKKTVFTPEQERELIEHIKNMESRMYGLTKQDILSLAYQLAAKNNIAHPFSVEKKKAGVDWWKGFRKRHPDIALRSPESTSAARARAFNKPVVDKFFTVLKNTQKKQHIPPHRMFNVDETSLCTVPTKNTKVFAQAGRKQVARVTSAERGDTTTAVICCSAAGMFIPPMFIFRRLRMKIELMDGAPPGSVYACNSSGWMKLKVFDQWFDHFLAHIKPSADDPAILILDGHLSHTKNLSVVLKARQNHVVIICLPPHCTHKLQPLDVGVMYPLSVYHNQELEKWMNNHPGRVVSVFQIIKIFAGAYLRAPVPINAINGFSKCGIYPLNQDVFTDVDYVAAETTEVEMDLEADSSSDSISVLDDAPTHLFFETSAVSTVQDSLNLNPEPPSEVYNNSKTDRTETLPSNDREKTSPERTNVTPEPTSLECIYSQNDKNQPSAMLSSEQANTSNKFPLAPLCENDEFQPYVIPSSEQWNTSIKSNQICESLQTLAFKMISSVIMPTNITQAQEIGTFSIYSPSTSFGGFGPRDLRPLPKIEGKRNRNIRKRKIDTSILTSTPYKNYLEEEMQKKIEKEDKQRSRKDRSIKSISGKKTKEREVGKEKKVRKGKGVAKEKGVGTGKEVTKGKGVGKGKTVNKKQGEKKKNTKKQRNTYESESSEEDADCMFCTEPYSKDGMGEGWIRCMKCSKWGHEACAGLDSDDEEDFICDFCRDCFGNSKKQLNF